MCSQSLYVLPLLSSLEISGGLVNWRQIQPLTAGRSALLSLSLLAVLLGRSLLTPLLRHGRLESLTLSFTNLNAELAVVLTWVMERKCLNQALKVMDFTGTDLQLTTLRTFLQIMSCSEKVFVGVTPAADELEVEFGFLELENEFLVEVVV